VDKALPSDQTCDGVIVATPASRHLSSIESVRHLDVPIFVEKPMAVTRDEAYRICEMRRPRIFVMHTWRYHAGIQLLARLAHSNEFGPLRMLRSTRSNWTSPRTDVDPIWTLLPHDLSIAYEILGVIPRTVFAQAELVQGTPVGMLAILKHDSVDVVLEVSTRSVEKTRRVELHFEGGVAVLPNDHDGRISILRSGDAIEALESVPWPMAPGALYRQLEVFVNYLKGGDEPKCTARVGASIVEAVLELRTKAGLP
jgi:predicted dehydrogenase